MARLIRLDRPVGTLLLLWPTLTALWLAEGGWPGMHLFAVMLLGTFCMRSAGCAVNDIADRHIDGKVERTRDRPLATGSLTPRSALMVAAALTCTAGLLVLSVHWTVALVALAALPVAAGYPYVKRFSNYPQAVLGIAFAWGVPVAWVAAADQLPQAALWLFCGTWFWILSYDTQYAMRDRPDDLKIGVGSSAIGFGPHERLAIAICQALTLFCWWCSGSLVQAGVLWKVAVATIALVFGWQLWLIRNREPEACFSAFNLNALAGAVLFIGALGAGWL